MNERLTRFERAELNKLFVVLPPKARRVANQACRAYRHRRNSRDFAGLLRETQRHRARAKRASRALKQVKKALKELEAGLRSSWGNDLNSICETIRGAYIPANAPVALYLKADQHTWNREYLRAVLRREDPAQSLEPLLTLRKPLIEFIDQAVIVLKERVGQMKDPPRGRHNLFAVAGSLEYLLSRLFEGWSTRKLKTRDVEEKIGQILTFLDGGTRSVDSRGGCPAVRQAIKRLSSTRRAWCDRWLSYRLSRP